MQRDISSERRRVLSGFPARRAAADSERRHSFSQDSLLGQGSKSMGRPAEETSPDPIRPAESGPAVGAGSTWKALAGAVRRFATTPGCVVELQEARKRLRQSGARDPSEPTLFAHILLQRRLVKEATSQPQAKAPKGKNTIRGDSANGR